MNDQISNRKNEQKIKWITLLSLGLILVLGAFLRFYQVGVGGYGNDYYAATVKSMLTSWHNFFFVSYEPGGSISVDKPPLGFWLEAASAYAFGVNGFALALPNVLAGLGSIYLLFNLVKKPFGRIPALIAALTLAVMPITIATEQNNTIDGMLVFMLLLSAWAFFKSVEKQKLSYLFLGVVFLGLGFNIKMLQAYMVAPALYLVYFLGTKQKWWKRLLHLGAATLVLAVISFSWALIVDAVPAAERPFVGSSSNNSELELIFGHNGVDRFTNGRGSGSLSSSGNRPGNGQGDFPGGNQGGNPPEAGDLPGLSAGTGTDSQPGTPPGSGNPPAQSDSSTAGNAPGEGGQMQPPKGGNQAGGGNGPQNGGGPGQMGGGRSFGPGQSESASIFRLFTLNLGTQASWLLPFALLVIALFIIFFKRVAAGKEALLSVLFWAVWLLPMLLYFSFTRGTWHTYYLIMLGPAIAALTAIGFWLIEKVGVTSTILSKALLTVLTAGTVGYAVYLMTPYTQFFIAFAIIISTAWLIAAILYWIWPRRWSLFLMVLVCMLAPTFWSVMTVRNTADNSNLPSATPSFDNSSNLPANSQYSDKEQSLTEYLLENTQEGTYLLATMSSRQASSFILSTGRPVLTFGGFTGSDDAVDVTKLEDLVNSGQLRYVLDSGDLQNKEQIYTWVKENCKVVDLTGINNSSGNSGQNRPGGGFGGQSSTLYDCQ
ncbi:MAG: glycosyltransferase family 39 protein [Anaerolineaceae bacterium]|nr:glycosyltransferase family 39 protein [Anaerolineaceae bacterium]